MFTFWTRRAFHGPSSIYPSCISTLGTFGNRKGKKQSVPAPKQSRNVSFFPPRCALTAPVFPPYPARGSWLAKSISVGLFFSQCEPTDYFGRWMPADCAAVKADDPDPTTFVAKNTSVAMAINATSDLKLCPCKWMAKLFCKRIN